MHKHTESAPLPGRGAGDPHKKTSRSAKAHDRYRRLNKRRERVALKTVRRQYK